MRWMEAGGDGQPAGAAPGRAPWPATAKQPPAVRAALVSLAVLALVIVVAVGSNRSLASVGGPGHPLNLRSIAGDIEFALAAVVLAALALDVYLLWGSGRRRKSDEPDLVREQPPVPRWMQVLAVALSAVPAAALALMLALYSGHHATHRRPPVPGTLRPGVHLGTPGAQGGPAGVHWWFWGALAAVAAVAVVVMLMRRRVARPAPEDRPWKKARQALPAVIEESLADIEGETDPRRAVIRAYVGMEHALAGHGLGRRPFEAPQEYLSRVLAAVQVSGPAGVRLTRLFQRARFSEHVIAARMKRDAVEALAAVRDELAEHGP